jgi:hypothetical protein
MAVLMAAYSEQLSLRESWCKILCTIDVKRSKSSDRCGGDRLNKTNVDIKSGLPVAPGNFNSISFHHSLAHSYKPPPFYHTPGPSPIAKG